VGYGGLKHLKFSKMPELVGIWNRNPQEIVDFKNLEFLEVCNYSSNMKSIFNLSMASSLAQLQQLEIKRCNNLKAVVMEEEATTTTDDKVIIFPLLKSMIIEDCPNLTSFYRGISSPSLIQFPSLTKFEVSHCPNMTAFVSAFSRDKLAIIDDGTESANGDIHILTPFFCHKALNLG
ncbi:hypothetical protein CCACVL1_02675, partial [Corchorus capsularis]